MDLGAKVCTRSSPGCERCPVQTTCSAKKKGTVSFYPGRKPKKAKPLRETTMLLASAGNSVFLERRPESGIWGGLWSLPELDGRTLDDWCYDVLGAPASSTERWKPLRHSFTHYDLDIRPILVRVEAPLSKVADGDSSTWYRMGETPPGGLAAPVKKLLEQLHENH